MENLLKENLMKYKKESKENFLGKIKEKLELINGDVYKKYFSQEELKKKNDSFNELIMFINKNENIKEIFEKKYQEICKDFKIYKEKIEMYEKYDNQMEELIEVFKINLF